MAETENTAEKQRPAHLFKPGQSGNPRGRPRGARSRLGEDFIRALADDFEQHGAAVIEKVRTERPAVYLRVIAGLLPQQATLDVNVDVFRDVTNVVEAFRVASSLIGADPRAGLRRLQRLAPRIEIDAEPIAK